MEYDNDRSSNTHYDSYTYGRQDQQYYTSAHHFNGSSPPPIQSMFIAIRDRIADSDLGVLYVLAASLTVYFILQQQDRILDRLEQRGDFITNITSINAWHQLFRSIWSFLKSAPESLRNLRPIILTQSTPNGYYEKRLSSKRGIVGAAIGRNSKAPELEDVSTPSSPTPVRKEEEIEPAFLSQSDYPEEWLVYDRIFGIVPKGVLDSWRREENGEAEEKKDSAMPQSFGLEGDIPGTGRTSP